MLDVTSLARLQAGSEIRRIESLDVTTLLQALCEGIRPLAAKRGLYLNCQGPDGSTTDGDAVKIRRIAQNLILNAVEYTHEGGITVTWGDSSAEDPKRWVLCVSDTGAGFHTGSGKPLAVSLEETSEPAAQSSPTAIERDDASVRIGPPISVTETGRASGEPGEGIGLSIVECLCDMLDATVEMHSVIAVGTTFRVFFPRHYSGRTRYIPAESRLIRIPRSAAAEAPRHCRNDDRAINRKRWLNGFWMNSASCVAPRLTSSFSVS